VVDDALVVAFSCSEIPLVICTCPVNVYLVGNLKVYAQMYASIRWHE
jgi:hypothetical protein